MHRLEQEFAGRVEFFHLDFDIPVEKDALTEYDVRSRSSYVLLDGDGNVVQTWIGRITEPAMIAQINEQLDALGQ